MFGFVLRRVALIVPTFIGVTLLAFALIHLIPGDPVENLSGERGMDPARRERLLHEFGLDRPLPVQYADYVRQVMAAGMRCADDTRLGVGEQQWSAVGGRDSDGELRLARHHRIGAGPRLLRP